MHKITRRSLAISSALALLLASSLAHADVWNMPTRSGLKNYQTQIVVDFGKEVDTATNGKIKIVVHPEDSLFKQPDVKRAVQTGQIPIGEILMSMHGNESPWFEIDSIPFVAPSIEESRQLWKNSRSHIESALAKQGLQLLFITAYPPNAFFTKKEIRSVSDLKGVKFRAFNAQTARLAELMGATPVTVQQSEVPQAFSTGVIQAMVTGPATGVDTQSWDFVNHYYAVNAMITWNIVFANKRAFEKLDKPTRDILLAAAEKAEKSGWEQASQVSAQLIATLKSHGMQIHEPTPDMRREFSVIGKTMAEEWLKKVGPEGRPVLEPVLANK